MYTKPGHRTHLKAEIVRLNIHDGLPDYKPVGILQRNGLCVSLYSEPCLSRYSMGPKENIGLDRLSD